MRLGSWPGILAFEWRYHTHRFTFAVVGAFFVVMGFALAASGFGEPDVHLNGSWQVSQAVGLLTLVSVFGLTLFTSRAVLRDGEHQMEEIVFATSITRGQYLIGRYLGVLLVAATAFALALAGMVAGTFLVPHDPSRLGPLVALDYLWPFLVLALPSLLAVAMALFVVAIVTRSSIATSVTGVSIYVLYFVGAILTDSPLMASSGPASPEGLAAAALIDPFGLTAFYEQTRFWTVAERNARSLSLEGPFLWNRLLWLGIALGALGLTYRFFAFRSNRDQKGAAPGPPEAPPAARGARLGPVAVATGWRASLAAGGAAIRLELRGMIKNWPFAVLLALAVGTFGIEVTQRFLAAEFGTRLIPTTGLVLGGLREALVLFGILAVLYYSAELVWRERAVRIDEIVDATPVTNRVLLMAKLSALVVLVGGLISVAIAVGALFQLMAGHPVVELDLYASWFFFVGLPLVLLAVLAVLIQCLVSHRYAGMLVALLATIVWHKGGLGGPDHPLLQYAAAPEVLYSAMNGLSPARVSFSWYMSYWGVVAALLILVTAGLWRRGTDSPVLARARSLPARVTPIAGWAGGLAGAAVFALGGAIYHQTNVRHGYETVEQRIAFKADYERAYRDLDDRPQPTLARIEAGVDLFPETRRFEIRGRYRLENRTSEPIVTVTVVNRRDVVVDELTLDGRAPSTVDSRFASASFGLESPLQPGASAELAFALRADRRGARAGGEDHDVVGNGSFLLSTFALPTVGYRRSRELRDPQQRREQGLEALSRPTTLEEAVGSGLERSSLRTVTFEATVSTSSDQIALAPGDLVDSWEVTGRRFFRYRVDTPMMPYFAVASARYSVARRQVGEIEVEVYHHPEHGANVARILEAAARTLDYCVSNYGDYPHRALRIVEIPAYWQRFAGHAQPGVVFLVEDRAFLTDLRDPSRPDLVTKRVAHEIAHQWWGHQLSPPEEPGASSLVETLARFTEMRVVAARDGELATWGLLATERERYLRGRTRGDEVPLYQVGDQSYLYYSKGAVVMAALTDLIGEGAVNRAIRELLQASASPDARPTSLDLLAHLSRVTPESQRELLAEWWREVILYDLSVVSAQAEPRAGGGYRVVATVAGGKTAIRGGGKVALPLDEPVDLGVFAEFPRPSMAEAMILGTVRPHLSKGTTRVEVLVDEVPAYVAIDPFVRRLDRNVADNVRKVVLLPSRGDSTAPKEAM